MTVDHRRGVGTARMAALSTIRTVDRLYVGAWSADGDGLRVAIGEPGATSAIATVRALVDAANSTA